jgi:hypothetical protein
VIVTDAELFSTKNQRLFACGYLRPGHIEIALGRRPAWRMSWILSRAERLLANATEVCSKGGLEQKTLEHWELARCFWQRLIVIIKERMALDATLV